MVSGQKVSGVMYAIVWTENYSFVVSYYKYAG